jgi:cytochrome c biogenesis protein CcdA
MSTAYTHRTSSTLTSDADAVAQRSEGGFSDQATGAPLALGATLVALGLWAAKATSIAVTGEDATLASILFAAGLVAFFVAVGALAAAVTRGRPAWLRVIAGICAIALGTAASLTLNAVIVGIRDPEDGAHWAWGELNLWVVGLTVLALTLRVHTRGRGRIRSS